MRRTAALLVTAFIVGCESSPVQPQIDDLAALGARLASLRDEYDIPALSVGVQEGNGTPWTLGLGQVTSSASSTAAAPTSTSVFHLASLTKTFAAAIVLQLVDEGRLSLDDNVSKFGVTLENSTDVRVRHLLSHTSEGTPGTQFRYNGDRYALLDRVIQQAAGKSFGLLLAERVTTPLGLGCTGPSSSPTLSAALVRGFESNGTTPLTYPTGFSSAAGMVSCVRDMLEFSRAWDSGQLVPASRRALAWTAVVSPTVGLQPHGLGWFVDDSMGTKVVWHYGWWTGISALIVKLPERGLTFVLLANNDQLSAGFRLGFGELRSSPFARAFLAWALQREVSG